MNKTTNFGTSLKELEDLVNLLEKGDISLEESLKYYEKAMAITHDCQKMLTEAEQKIEVLSNNNLQSENFDE